MPTLTHRHKSIRNARGKPSEGKVPAVILCRPKFPHNVGAALRACSCFGAKQIWWTGNRVSLDTTERLPREERMKGYKVVDQIQDERAFDVFRDHKTKPTIVAVEVLGSTESLISFEHPENAVYVFGPEDGSLDRTEKQYCHRFVAIPTHFCLNLASAVNVILYDRRAKRVRDGLDEDVPIADMLLEHRGYFSAG